MSKLFSFLGLGGQKRDVVDARKDGAPVPRTASTNNELSDGEIKDLVARITGPVQTGTNRFEAERPLPVPTSLIATIAQESVEKSGPLLDDSDLERVQELVEEWEACAEKINGFSQTRVEKTFSEHQATVVDAAIAGKPVNGPRTKADVRADFAHHRGALKIACRNHSAEAAGFFEKAAGKLIKHLQARAEQEAISEFRRFAAYGVNFRPSDLVLTMLAAGEHLKEMSDRMQRQVAGLGTHPRQMFETLGIEL